MLSNALFSYMAALFLQTMFSPHYNVDQLTVRFREGVMLDGNAAFPLLTLAYGVAVGVPCLSKSVDDLCVSLYRPTCCFDCVLSVNA